MSINSCLLALLIFLSYQASSKEIPPNLTVQSWSNTAPSATTAAVPTSKSFFNSRLEYSNKWLPVGRSDPLKNDPTYDYSPPAADHRVRYWEEKSTKTNGNKNEILLLGVSSRRQYSPNNYVQRPSDISTVMLPPPIQPVQKMNFKSEKSPNRQSQFGPHNKWQDTVSSDSNVRPTIVFPNAVYDHKINSNADDVNKLLTHTDIHSVMYTKSNQSKKSWLQDLLQKEVARPMSSPSPLVQIEAINMLKLDDTNRYKIELPTEYYTEATPQYFVPTLPTVQPSITKANQFLFEEMLKPMNPMNLIIQGHSRVKTYGQGTDERDPKIIEVKSVDNPIVNRVVSQDDNGIQFDVKHLHASSSSKATSTTKNSTVELGNSPVAGLLSLLDLSFGGILADNSPDEVSRTKSNTNKIL